MVFRRQMAPRDEQEWVEGNRRKVEIASLALQDLLEVPANKGTLRKDRLSLANFFSDLAQVFNTRSLDGTDFSEDNVDR